MSFKAKENTLDVIVPVRNEQDNVAKLVQRIDSALKSSDIEYKIIFIDDNSSDNTAKEISKLSSKYNISLYKKRGSKGKAYSIIEGLGYSKSDLVAMIDGDLQYPPEAIPGMFTMLKENPKLGMVVANRQVRHENFIRNFSSKVYKLFFAKLLLGLDCDVQSGLKVFRSEIGKHLSIDMVKPWTVDLPLITIAIDHGYKIGSQPIEFSQRTGGQSKVSVIGTSIQIASEALKYRLGPSRIYTNHKSSDSSLHTEVVHKGKRFTTHSSLPHHLSAVRTFTRIQLLVILSIFVFIFLGAYISPTQAAIAFVATISFVYFLDVLFNLFLVVKSINTPPEIVIEDAEIKSLDDSGLPTYTILCPLYKEAEVLPHFVENMANLDWPKNKLEVILLLEENDLETQKKAEELDLPKYFKTLIVPHSYPKTKPKACNYGLHFAKGEFIVIYDAEDRPEKYQLKKAYLAYKKSPPTVGCLQAKLNYFNPHDNLLTRFFTAEYSLWFDITLPGLQSINTAIPLGGTSNHFRTDVLRSLHGWDAFNVTEDADFGARLFKLGYTTAIIDSTTLEEANSNWGNWLRQRSRWIKGYMQTFLVHNRNPLSFIRSHGIHAFIFQLIVGGKISFMLINPVLWAITIAYFAAYQVIGPTIESLYPPVIFYMAAFSAVFGNFLFIYYYMLGCAKRSWWSLMKFVYLIPIYWLMVSVASLKALYQLVVNPHFWEKTHHGLNLNIKINFLNKIVSYFKKNASPGMLILCSILGNIINFSYNSYFGRKLSLEDFGFVSAFGAISYIGGIVFASLISTITHSVAFLGSKYKLDQILNAYKKSTLPYVVAITVIWVISIPFLNWFFHIDTNVPFLLLVPFWIISLWYSFVVGGLSGSQRFAALGIVLVIEAAAKFIVAYILIESGLQKYLYAAIPLSIVFSTIIGLWIMKISGSKNHSVNIENWKFPTKFFSASLLGYFSTSVILSIDVILARHFLDPIQAGQFSLISMAGKVSFFFVTLFTQFVNPIVSKFEGEGKKSSKSFYYIITLGAISGICIWVATGLLGKYTLPILFGSKIIQVSHLVSSYSAAMIFYALSGAIVSYHQAKKEYFISIIGSILALGQILIFLSFRNSLFSLVFSSLVYSGVTFGIILISHTLSSKISIVNRNIRDFLEIFKSRFVFKSSPKSSNGLRILILNWRDVKHKWAGGAEVYVQELAKRWVESGHSVTIFCGNDGKSSRNDVVDGVRIIRRGGFYFVYVWAVLYYLFKLRKEFDLVIDSENGIPFFSPLYVSVPVVLLVHHIHQDVFRLQLNPFLAMIATVLESKVMPMIYRNCKVVTVSDSSKSDLVRHKLAVEGQIDIVHPGIDPKSFKIHPKTPNPTILYFGRNRPYKNIDIAIKSMPKVLKVYPKAKMIIAGGGDDSHNLKNLASKLGLLDSVKFLGYLESDKDKNMYLSSSWVMVQPSSFEGWGITVIEANACGTPVIASNVVGLRDSVKEGESGYLISPKNPDLLSQKIIQIFKDSSKYKKLCTSSIQWSKKFTWEESSHKFMLIIKDIFNTSYISSKEKSYVKVEN